MVLAVQLEAGRKNLCLFCEFMSFSYLIMHYAPASKGSMKLFEAARRWKEKLAQAASLPLEKDVDRNLDEIDVKKEASDREKVREGDTDTDISSSSSDIDSSSSSDSESSSQSSDSNSDSDSEKS